MNPTEQIATFTASENVNQASEAVSDIDRQINDFYKKNPNITVTDRKMSTTSISVHAYIITVSIFYKPAI